MTCNEGLCDSRWPLAKANSFTLEAFCLEESEIVGCECSLRRNVIYCYELGERPTTIYAVATSWGLRWC
jgi:hypothetical protein